MNTELKALIESWKGDSRAKGMDYLLVVDDTFNHEEYPVFCTQEELAAKKAHYDGPNMQRVVEVIKLDRAIKMPELKIGSDFVGYRVLTNESTPEQVTDFRKSVDQADREVELLKVALTVLPGVIAARDRYQIEGNRDLQNIASGDHDALAKEAWDIAEAFVLEKEKRIGR